MRKIISVLLVLAMSFMCLTGCKKSESTKKVTHITKETKEEPDIDVPEYDDKQIAFIEVYANYAWEYCYEVSAYTADGTRYDFDFSNSADTNHTVEEVFDMPLGYGEDAKDEDEMRELIASVYGLDELKFEEKSVMCDFGEYTLYAVVYDEDGSHELIMLGQYGDLYVIPKDKVAKNICKEFNMTWD